LHGLLSVTQSAISTPWFSHVLRETCCDSSRLVVVGWSFGSQLACHIVRQLEVSGLSLRGVCNLDDRASKPTLGQFDWEYCAQSRPRVRILTPALEFVSPLKFVRKERGLDPVRFFGFDYEMTMKRVLNFSRTVNIWLEESSHHSMGVVNVWDLGERLKSSGRPQLRRHRRRLARIAAR
ncbi:unnamed protein product, partial [Symbiodinium pilosum]